MKQATLNFDLHLKKTRKREFMGQMEQVVPWTDLVALNASYYPKA
jgi:IS5 family transposase